MRQVHSPQYFHRFPANLVYSALTRSLFLFVFIEHQSRCRLPIGGGRPSMTRSQCARITRVGAPMSAQLPATILYVDDNEANRHTFGWIFRSAGFEVKEAASG